MFFLIYKQVQRQQSLLQKQELPPVSAIRCVNSTRNLSLTFAVTGKGLLESRVLLSCDGRTFHVVNV